MPSSKLNDFVVRKLSLMEEGKHEEFEKLSHLRDLVVKSNNESMLENFDQSFYFKYILIDQVKSFVEDGYELWFSAVTDVLQWLELKQTTTTAGMGIVNDDDWFDGQPEVVMYSTLTAGMDAILRQYEDARVKENLQGIELDTRMNEFFEAALSYDKNYANWLKDISTWKHAPDFKSAIEIYFAHVHKDPILKGGKAWTSARSQYHQVLEDESRKLEVFDHLVQGIMFNKLLSNLSHLIEELGSCNPEDTQFITNVDDVINEIRNEYLKVLDEVVDGLKKGQQGTQETRSDLEEYLKSEQFRDRYFEMFGIQDDYNTALVEKKGEPPAP